MATKLTAPEQLTRRAGIASLVGRLIVLILVSFAVTLSAGATPQADTADPPSRSFAFSYVVKLDPIAGNHKVRAFIPLPSTDDFQTISELQLQAPEGIHIHKYSDAGSRYASFTADPSHAQAPFEVRLTFRVTRYERRLDMMPVTSPQGPLPRDVTQFLQADQWGPLDESIATLARQQTQGIADPLQKARKIFEYVVSATRYDAAGASISEDRSDTSGACDSPGNGCTGFNSLFISMARAAGIPARLEIGFSLPDGQKQGIISGYHCWAEFYVNGTGWIPLDASRARQEPEKRDDFFGAIDARRVMISNSRGNASFAPAASTGPFNYLVDPYVEIDGKPCSDYSANFFFQEGEFAGPAPSRKTIYARSYLDGAAGHANFAS